MPRNVAPTKVTGGGGFNFEDKVTAFFMCHLLLNRPPLDPSFGIITKISFQVRVDHFLPDDLLLHLNKGEKEIFCAFSIKSNTQFSKTSAPSDFVQDAWEQYLGEIDSVFKKNKDRLGIITTPLDTDTKTKLEGLLNKARSQDSNKLSKRIDEEGYVSKEAISIFKSFLCPKPLADKYSVGESDTGNLLKCIEHLEFDFENTASKDKNRAIGMIKESLSQGSTGDEENLWDTLCAIARDIRSDGGRIDLEFLVSKLRSRYRLKDFPDFVSFWESIKQKTRDTLDLIPDKIADVITIDRSTEITEIKEKLHNHSNVVLLGESGCGKSVIQKSISESECNSSKVVWINADTVSFLQELHTWDMFRLVTDETAFLVIDGIDRFYDFRDLALLLKACSHKSETNPWKIIISSQPDAWGRVQASLSRLNVVVDFSPYTIDNPKDEVLNPVWVKFPALKNLSLHLHLRTFLFKPKVLDLFARRVKEGESFDAALSSDTTIGESHLISWYWECEIEHQKNGLQYSKLLKRISANLADNLTHDIPSSDFSTDELAVIQELHLIRILRVSKDRISFEHDIIADWARLRILLDETPSVSNYLEGRLSSPLWCRVLRLLGIHMLEVGTSINDWKQLFDSFAKEGEKGNAAQDLLLEAAIFSSDPQNNLNKLWPELIKNNGSLLRRLLVRFQYSASFPSRFVLLVARQYPDESLTELLASNREPYWLYWKPMILFLYSHKGDVINMAKRQLAEITDRWLRFSKKDWPGRTEAAEMALDIAENELALNMSNIMYLDKCEMSRYAYRAGIAACDEFSERTLDFILTAGSRKTPSDRILELIASYNEEERVEREKAKQRMSKDAKKRLSEMRADASQLIFKEGPTPPPWPDGPLVTVN